MDFREDCATALVSRKDIEEAVSWSSGKVNPNHLTHAITSADRRNHGGMFEPFCVAIGHAAGDYIGLLEKVAARAKHARSGKRRKLRR